MRKVTKPWGQEIWFELNDKYCYKMLRINSGHRTSYQYHEKKLETIYVSEGQVEVLLENDEGEVVSSVLTEGDVFTVQPLRKHRMTAITNVTLLEVSTPEVDDVVRLEDDNDREDGKIDSEHED